MSETPESYRLLIADVYELAGLSRRTSEALARTAGQTTARWHVLSVVSDGPRTVSSAARRLGLARQSVQRVVDGLVADGDLELRANPDHARAPLVAISPSGAAVLAELVRRSDADRSALLGRAGVSAAELDAARAVVRRLLSALGAADRRPTS
ncbi:MarR family winged helix-turn-helix transcriptional regulator [Blastococcus haudaquaticus]|uniref:MarR family protein n=1 Tax=Blastococcus haudaquaticus TaxID=1938745 RepID=A0A286H4G1_9ACTN|nr:MarR family winged helix-turn-helix transcriptional regulator [Blastococcus haudaquaticus]SOE02582.1 MarR family protein [Blastococcus haudaquaticus]